MSKIKFKRNNKQEGITLVALVVTIVVLLILAGITIAALFSDNGIIASAQRASDQTKEAVDNTEEQLKNLAKDLNKHLDEISGKKAGPTIKVGDTEVTLTKENVKDYLGKVVTNYKGKSSITIGSNTYNVSTQYRLYYVDFDGKYGEKGTIYLKADQPSESKALPINENGAAITAETSKVKALNPELYKEGKTPPTDTWNNMQAVRWLLDTSKWEGLKPTEASKTDIASSDINYVVGAPSLEMFMDSYNTKYSLTGDAPSSTGTGERNASSERVKLFYQYPYDSNNCGYGVGPGKTAAWNTYTDSYYTVLTDSTIDPMYYPVDNKKYWLASPSASGSGRVLYVDGGYGGRVYLNYYDTPYGLCPLVSLKSNVQIKTAN